MLDHDGFHLHRGVLSPTETRRLLDAMPPVTRGGARSLLELDAVVELVRLLRERSLVPAGFFAVRAVLFDKTPDANWSLQWHQDTTIAVEEKRDAPGYGPWTTKAGVTHVTAPQELLSSMAQPAGASRCIGA